MNNKLTAIIEQKQREVRALHQRLAHEPIPALQIACAPSFRAALQREGLSVIAEIKRQSPSKGRLAPIANPIDLAHQYIKGGARALSILTDELFFGGCLDDLRVVRNTCSTPILRKDFVIDRIQIAEAAACGASAVLCIVAVLGEQCREMIAFAKSLHLDVLVEVHDKEELSIALDCGADIIGVNNRDLKTFAVDTARAFELLPDIPHTVIAVAESGIATSELASAYHKAGFDAVLIGEALVQSAAPDAFIEACYVG